MVITSIFCLITPRLDASVVVFIAVYVLSFAGRDILLTVQSMECAWTILAWQDLDLCLDLTTFMTSYLLYLSYCITPALAFPSKSSSTICFPFCLLSASTNTCCSFVLCTFFSSLLAFAYVSTCSTTNYNPVHLFSF